MVFELFGWVLVLLLVVGIGLKLYLLLAPSRPFVNVEPAQTIVNQVDAIVQQLDQCMTNPNNNNNNKDNKDDEKNHPTSYDGILAGNEYDVCIMGGGAAGVLQAYHLQLYSPGLKICIIDPLPSSRTGMTSDGEFDSLDRCHKIGESTVFPSAMFLLRDLGLGDYLIEQHAPKYGLFYLWPKDAQKTETWHDYYSSVSLRMPELPSFQLDRVKLERDLITMIMKDKKTPVTYIQGTVKTFILQEQKQEDGQGQKQKHEDGEGEAEAEGGDHGETAYIYGQKAHSVQVIPINNKPTEETSSTPTPSTTPARVTVHASHLIDCAGRAFLIGRRKKLLRSNPTDVMDIQNGSVWVHVTDFDVSLFVGDASRGQTLSSWYYATNHFCGDGYWLWVIPIETRHGRALSIGVSFHKQVHEMSSFSTVDKFLRFLEMNQNILYRVITSGTIRLFRKLPRLAHYSTQFYDSRNNWYITGEAAYNADPWYSTGLTWCSFQIQHVTTVITAKTKITKATYMAQQLINNNKLSNDQQSVISQCQLSLSLLHAESIRMCSHYNTFATNLVRLFFLNITRHWKHLGNASIMSWRLLLETSPQHVPISYMTKTYLCPIGCSMSTKHADDRIWLMSGIYDLFDELVDRKANVGYQDYNEPNRVPFFHRVALDFLDADDSLRDGKLSYKSCNISRVEAVCQLYMLMGVILLVWRGFGWRGFIRPLVYQRLGYLSWTVIRAQFRAIQWDWNNHHLIVNPRFHQREQEFKNYIPKSYVPW